MAVVAAVAVVAALAERQYVFENLNPNSTFLTFSYAAVAPLIRYNNL